MMKRMTNAEFHKFLNEFSEEVSKGRYRKMPYDKYRTFRNWRDTSVDVVLDNYTNLNGDRVQRIRISPNGPTGYEFYIDDGSFGNFCYDYLKKEEPKVHPDENKYYYDLFGNYSKVDYAQSECATATSATSAKEYIDSLVSTYDRDNHYATAVCYDTNSGIAMSSNKSICGEISLDIEPLKKRVEEVGKITTDTSRTLMESVNSINTRIEESEYRLRELEDDICRKVNVDELDYQLDKFASEVSSEFAGTDYDIKLLRDRISELEDKVEELSSTQTQGISSYPVKSYSLNIAGESICADNRKEKENMDTNKMFSFDFGPVASHIRMSPYGLAMKNADGKYVSYDKATGSVMDVEIFNFDAQKFLYKMPVAVNQVAVGDIVVHMRKPMFVRAVKDGVVSVIDIYNAEAKDILPVKSPFGFNFITKVVSLIDMTGANADTPFGNMLPFLMMGEGKDFKDILPMMLFANGSNANMMNNPMMMYALLNDSKNIDSLGYFLALTNGMFNNNPPASTQCNCGCHNGENHQ